MSSDQTRTWGYWSQAKLQILHEYLPRFLRASQTAKERIYIDAFAGAGHGVDRLSGEEFNGSARIALDAAAGPTRFTRLLYFEQEHLATNLDATLRAAYPGRNISVRGGDCNAELPSALKSLASIRWAPTFAFIDPDGLEFHWDTLKALADHKRGYRGATANKPEYKAELWILFSTQGLIRTLALDHAKLRTTDEERASALFGTEQWRHIYELRQLGRLGPLRQRKSTSTSCAGG